jgi:hypothetical protein
MKIATSANSTLIITDGTMKSIGQAIAEYNINNTKVFLLGINNWGKVDERDKLEVIKTFQNEHLLKKCLNKKPKINDTSERDALVVLSLIITIITIYKLF